MNNRGFSLLELLIAISIMSVLTAIALPQYLQYKRQAYDSRAVSDLRNVAIAEEAYYMTAERYLACQNATCTRLPGIAALSKGVNLQISVAGDGFTGTAGHSKGSGKTFRWDSNRGGLQ